MESEEQSSSANAFVRSPWVRILLSAGCVIVLVTAWLRGHADVWIDLAGLSGLFLVCSIVWGWLGPPMFRMITFVSKLTGRTESFLGGLLLVLMLLTMWYLHSVDSGSETKEPWLQHMALAICAGWLSNQLYTLVRRLPAWYSRIRHLQID